MCFRFFIILIYNNPTKRQGRNTELCFNLVSNLSIFLISVGLIPVRWYPTSIFINMPNELVDVNVHPAKYEVRFSNEWQLYHLIKSSFSESLKDVLNVIPSVYKDINFSNINSTGIPSYGFGPIPPALPT